MTRGRYSGISAATSVPPPASTMRLLDEALIESFPDESERELLRRPDRLGLGSAP